jgi:hypothetical protein
MTGSSEPVAGGSVGNGEAKEAKPEREHQNVHGTKPRRKGLPHGMGRPAPQRCQKSYKGSRELKGPRYKVVIKIEDTVRFTIGEEPQVAPELSPDERTLAFAEGLGLRNLPLTTPSAVTELVADPWSAAIFLFHDHA